MIALNSPDGVGNAVATHLAQVYAMAGDASSSGLGEIMEWASAAARARPTFLLLPLLSCQALGGDVATAVPVAAAWHLFFCAAHLVDDVADQAELPLPPAQTVNAAFGLTFLGQLSLAALGQPPAHREHALRLLDLFNRAAVRVVEGQAADLTWNSSTATLPDYWRMIGAKGGEWFALACRAGALCSSLTEEAERYGTFGYHLGILIQLNDDLNALWRPRGPGDLSTIDRTLPVVYGLTVAPPTARQRLEGLLPQVAGDAVALTELQSLLADLGALHFLTLQAARHHELAHASIQPALHPNPAQHALLAMLDDAFPVRSSTI